MRPKNLTELWKKWWVLNQLGLWDSKFCLTEKSTFSPSRLMLLWPMEPLFGTWSLPCQWPLQLQFERCCVTKFQQLVTWTLKVHPARVFHQYVHILCLLSFMLQTKGFPLQRYSMWSPLTSPSKKNNSRLYAIQSETSNILWTNTGGWFDDGF